MVLNLSQLIKISGTDPDSYRDYPAAKTQSLGLPAYAERSWFLQSPLDSFTVTQNTQPSTGIIPSRQHCLDTETFSHLPGLLSGPKKSRPSTGILQKLMPARAAVGN